MIFCAYIPDGECHESELSHHSFTRLSYVVKAILEADAELICPDQRLALTRRKQQSRSHPGVRVSRRGIGRPKTKGMRASVWRMTYLEG